MYEVQLEDSGERLEKKEQLRAKVQALVSYYEDEKRRNEELTMELERLKAEQQQMQSITGQAPGLSAAAEPAVPGAFGPSGPAPAPGMNPPPPGGIPFSQRPGFPPQQPAFPAPPSVPGGAPAAPEFPPQAPQAPGGYTLQSFGAPQAPAQPGFGAQPGAGPQGFAPQPPRPPMPQSPYGAPPAPWQQAAPPQPPQNPYGAPAPWQGMPNGMPAQPFGQFPPQQPWGAPAPWQQPAAQQPPFQQQGDALAENVGIVLQTITQVRAKLHQSESIRGYGYPQQAYMDADTVALLDKLYDQLGDLSRELMQRQAR